ncbi:MAG: DUF6119 family protein, partial [Acinetobacter sp.]
NDETFKTAFPDIQNIVPVRDPVVITQLNIKLIDALHSSSNDVSLVIPEIINYRDGLWATFTGVGRSEVYEDISVDCYSDYLSKHDTNINQIDFDVLKKHSLLMTDADGQPRGEKYSILKCLIFDTLIDDTQKTYHLCEGHWYLVEPDYINKLQSYLDPLYGDKALASYCHENEGDYNEKTADQSDHLICLDRTNIAPYKQTQIEPCDIFELSDNQAILHHIKIDTLSAQLSHLFNQGANSIKLLRIEEQSMSKLRALVEEKAPDNLKNEFLASLDMNTIKVYFGIVTRKDKQAKSFNLPLFSRISLMRCMKDLILMGIRSEFYFIDDLSPIKQCKPKKKKTKAEQNIEEAETGDTE